MGRAVHFFQKALAENPRNLLPRLHLIEVFHKLGEAERAVNNAELLIRKMMNNENLTNQVLQSLTQSGKENKDRPSPTRIIPLLVQALDTNLKDFEELKRRLLEGKSIPGQE